MLFQNRPEPRVQLLQVPGPPMPRRHLLELVNGQADYPYRLLRRLIREIAGDGALQLIEHMQELAVRLLLGQDEAQNIDSLTDRRDWLHLLQRPHRLAGGEAQQTAPGGQREAVGLDDLIDGADEIGGGTEGQPVADAPAVGGRDEELAGIVFRVNDMTVFVIDRRFVHGPAYSALI